MLPLRPETVVQGRYQVVSAIGRGGMGTVYEAIDLRLKRRVALKQMAVAGESMSKAFEREAQLLASLDHRMLPDVSDYFNDAAGQFLVMEFIPGPDLAALLGQRGAPFPVDQVLRWGDQLLDVLHYLHTRVPPIIHRDIKPQNLKLKSGDEIMLLDFGLAKGYSTGETQTGTRSLLGHTPGFAPPEQLDGSGTDPRSDLYALGATLHRLLTNAPPVDSLTRLRAAAGTFPDPLRPAHELNPEVPPSISLVLTLAQSLNNELRPANAMAMRAALSAARSATIAHPVDRGQTPIEAGSGSPTVLHEESTSSRPVTGAGAPARTGGSRKRLWLWLPLVALTLLTAAGGAAAFMNRSGSQRTPVPNGNGISSEAGAAVSAIAAATSTTAVATSARTSPPATPTPEATASAPAPTATSTPEDVTAIAQPPTPTPEATQPPAVQPGLAALPLSAVEGGYIYFSSNRAGSYDLYAMAATGGPIFQLTDDPENEWEPSVNVRTGEILYSSNRAYLPDHHPNNYDLFVIGEGSETERWKAVVDRLEWDAHPRWSPDGSQIAFVSTGDAGGIYNEDIFIRDNSGAVRQVTSDPGLDVDAEWSPDGRRLVGARILENKSGIGIVDLETQGETLLTNDGWREPWLDTRPAWSPDGRTIAFLRRSVDTNGNGTLDRDDAGDIWLIDVDTGTTRQLTDGSQSDGPRWAPDGNGLVFVQLTDSDGDGRILPQEADASDTAGLWYISHDGSSRRQLLEDRGLGRDPDWAP